MDGLIETVNEIQDAFTAVGISSPVDLPLVVVVGSQSSGKSSVLENIVGRDFLPRGSGIVTRRPLVLQLVHQASQEGKPEEWGEFLHQPGKVYTDFNEIRDEIAADTEEKTGGTKGISHLPINLRIFSPKVLTITLIDLPGLTKVAVHDQPKDIERQIKQMILKFITKANCIILAVTAANTDIANSDALKLARDVDPEGIRTIGVLTKIDLMDPGTTVLDVLSGKVIPLKLGYVPLVNRGQRDIEGKKSIEDALASEAEFFANHEAYSDKAEYCGTHYLTKRLNIILKSHIKKNIPDMRTKIRDLLLSTEDELKGLGVAINEPTLGTVLEIISEVSTEFCLYIDGKTKSNNELLGGARILFVLHQIYGSAIQSMNCFDSVKDSDIRTVLFNSSGSNLSLFVSSAAFEILIEQQIARFREPSLKCVEYVYDEIVRIVNEVIDKPKFTRFPDLKAKIYEVIIGFLRTLLPSTSTLVNDLVDSEIGLCEYSSS